MDPPSALAIAIVGAAAAGGVLAGLFLAIWFVRGVLTPGARLRSRALAGSLARVVVAIPRGGVGRIAYAAHGKRCSMAARCYGAGGLPAGTHVAVTSLERGVATVAPLDDHTLDGSNESLLERSSS